MKASGALEAQWNSRYLLIGFAKRSLLWQSKAAE
jgi:hypothetical protein